MGAWGAGIFADDIDADLRDEYRKLIGDGVTGPEATDRRIAQLTPRGSPDLEPVFWLALALTQWTCGRLEERVKTEALRRIEDGSALQPWADAPESENAGPCWKGLKEHCNPASPRIAGSKSKCSRDATGNAAT